MVPGVAFFFLTVTAVAQVGTAFVVYPEFQNALSANSSDNSSDQNSVAIFSGSEGAYSPPESGLFPSIPTNSNGIQLANSGFGQMLARVVPYANFEVKTIEIAQEKLYPPATAVTRELIAGSGTAFRYKELLYSGTGDSDIRAGFEGIASYFGDPERALASEGIEILRQGLKYSPLNTKLRNALLDAYYDLIVAETQYVKNDLAEVAKYRLGLLVVPPGKFIIDYEIAGYTNILQKYEGILEEYGKLFADKGGIDVSQVDPTAPQGIVLGQWIFQQEQPQRNQMAAQFRDANGILTTVPVTGSSNSPLFAGYKDYVALLGVMRDYAQSAAELAKLYGMRARGAVQAGQKDDKTLGFELIDGINREVLLNTSLLNALLPNAIPPASELDASGARAAFAGVLTGTAELTKVGSFLNSQVNVLGYDPDFLALISTFVNQDQSHLWDSYDALRGWLGDSVDPTSILGRARTAFIDAKNSYDTYQGHADQVATQLADIDDSYAQRYREITGYFPEDPPDAYPLSVPGGRYPPVDDSVAPSHVNNPRPGSELRQAYQSIEQSDKKAIELVSANGTITNQIELARQRLISSTNRTDLINAATKDFKGTIVTERDTITSWNSRQAAAQATYDTVSDAASVLGGAGIDPGKYISGGAAAGAIGVAGAVNIGIQIAGEEYKGLAEKNLALADADFQKNLALADTEQNIFQAGEEQRNLDRELQSVVLTMQDNQFVRSQESERVDGLMRELQQVAVLRSQNDADLASRYFADPIHFLRSQNNMIRADFAFKSAQRWVFFALRALEYKYNQPFVYTDAVPGSPRWELASIFRIRNAEELDDLLVAMTQFNIANLGKLNGRTLTTEKISLKDDVWGRTITGSTARDTEFQERIAASYDAQRGVYVINLNTLRLSKELENGSLFLGADYGTDGSIITKGNYLDKIDYIKIKFVDTSIPSPVTRPGDLSYSGTGFARSERPGCVVVGLESPPGELQSFPFRYFAMGTDPDTGVLEANSYSEQSANAEVVFWNEPDKAVEPTDTLNPAAFRSTFLKERSVAISDLNLTIAADKVDPGTLQDIHIYIRHLYALRSNCE